MQGNIVLIGFMGTGKSTIGRELSKMLSYPLVDTDQAIVKKAGKPIPRIFADEGEEAFRKMETEILEELAEKGGNIIATGGGIIGSERNREILRKLGYVVWLAASPKEILERTSRNSNRPLLNGVDPEGSIMRLLEERTPLYMEAAHLNIETDQLCFDEICNGIIESARYHYGTQ
ncbi:shikimate kinase [Akkermansiaceae bacterium]|nr:shikimate kinase [Akkermansiaceae bacterium]MDB4106816.1 shikimate kinase [bacterium]MDA7862585.1 shikimate kinase [Akkermansiaceae bacterium]MDA7864014.1 shikimate kinase [Akkermansiaceae bacterium]MDA7876834.1 shikimate kinase [Akkermansiaceae bacterium]